MIGKKYASLIHTAVSDYLVRPVRKTLGLRNYPTQLNYPVTGFCNSRCVMCNVWKFPAKWDRELTAGQLYEILRDPLYQKIQHWGLAGGEPTLRRDLVELVEAGLNALPKLKTVTISTHAFHTDRIKQLAPLMSSACKKRNVRLRFSISLDGVGEVHDRIRGIPGVFRKTMESIKWLQNETDIDVVIGATFSSLNVRDAFDLWYFCNRNNIPYNFRVATTVERLGNSDLMPVMTFDETEAYMLAELLENVAHDRRSSLERRFFYEATRKLLTDGVPKCTQCRFKDEGIYLDEEGRLHHCAVYGQTIGSAVGKSSEELFFSPKASALKDDMLNNACKTCIHDYRTSIPLSSVVQYALARTKVEKAIKVASGLVRGAFTGHPHSALQVQKHDPVIFVIGWYGTETAGDKAILAALFDRFRHANPTVRFKVGSYNPFYTRNTLRELGATGFAEVVSMTTKADIQSGVAEADAVVVGGGPLMDIPEIFDVMYGFNIARKKGIPRVIFGCGVGPANLRRTRAAIRAIGRLTTHAVLRDQKSKDTFVRLAGIEADRVQVSVDPAVLFAANHRFEERSELGQALRLGVSIRSLPKHYVGKLTVEELQKKNDELIQAYAQALDNLIEKHDAVVRFIPMNTFYIGDDDRWIQSDIYERMVHKDRVERNTSVYSAADILELIGECDMFLAMRFHSAVFANTLAVPTAAVEYNVQGGKVQAFMETFAGNDLVVNIRDVDTGVLQRLLDQLVTHRHTIAARLEKTSTAMRQHAEQEYDRMLCGLFGLTKKVEELEDTGD